MVGKPNVYRSERNEEDSLDLERAASMADEGGVAGALFEDYESPSRVRPARAGIPTALIWIAAGAASLGVLALYFNLRQRSEPALLPE